MILDHIGFTVSSAAASKQFFTAALAPLGITVLMEEQGWTGMGKGGKPEFWFGEGGDGEKPPQGKMHIAFTAESRAQVRAFYEAALAAGATDNGPPDIRAHYHPNYYGAFVIAPDGHNVEAVCHRAEG